MAPRNDPAAKSEEQELVITRTFDAPRELVWKAWTDPEQVMRWWGPKNFTSPTARIDLRVGGKYLFCMRDPNGRDFWSTGVYREIVPPERLVYTDSFADEHGNVVPASHYGMAEDFPLEMDVIVTFEEQDGKTTMTLRHVGLPAGEMSELTGEGWNESFDKLAESLRQPKGEIIMPKTHVTAEPGMHEVTITRTFDAPRDLVFRTYTDPTLVPRWWGPRGITTTVDKMDMRPGGEWRYVQRDADGNEYAFRGVYHEVTPPERLVYTFEFEGMPGHVLLETVIFEERDGKTTLIDKSVFQSVADRDGMVQSGMEQGAAESMDRLEELLVKQASNV